MHTCSYCKKLGINPPFTSEHPYDIQKHRKQAHPDVPKKGAKPTVLDDPFAKFRQGEELIKEALREVDAERNKMQQRLLELDDLAAKYRKVLNPNSH